MPNITYIQFTNPTAYPPLEHSALILQREGWNVRFLGVQWPGSGNFRFTSKLKASLSLLAAPEPGWKQKVFFLFFCNWALINCLYKRPQLVYVSDPMASPVGLLLKLLGFRVCYHEHDSPDAQSRSGFEFIIRLCRGQLGRIANLNILPQDARCQIFQREIGTQRPVLRIWNCPRQEEVSIKPRQERQLSQPLGIYYHGSISITRIPLLLIEAAGSSGLPIIIRVVGYETVGSYGTSNLLKDLAHKYRSSLQLELIGPRSRNQLSSYMNNMHLGWVAYPEKGVDVNLKHLAGASNKAFDYLAAGLALVTNHTSEWLKLYSNNGCAYSCDPNDCKSIQSSLIEAYHNPSITQQMGEAGRSKILNLWNYEFEFANVLGLING